MAGKIALAWRMVINTLVANFEAVIDNLNQTFKNSQIFKTMLWEYGFRIALVWFNVEDW